MHIIAIALAKLAMIFSGAIFIGIGTGSWFIGVGTWLCCMALYKSDK